MDIQEADVLEFRIQGEDLEREPWREWSPPLLEWGRFTFISVAYSRDDHAILCPNWDILKWKEVLMLVTLG